MTVYIVVMQRPDIVLKVSKPVPGDIVLHARVSITNQVPPRKRVLNHLTHLIKNSSFILIRNFKIEEYVGLI
jgi:hypothetical protein